MSDFGYRVLNGILGSPFLTVGTRNSLMKRLGFKLGNNSAIWSGGSFMSKKFTIGTGVFINVGFYFDGYDEMHIGDNVRIGQFVRVLTASHDIGPPHQRGLIEVVGKPVTIKDGCWIGAGVTILPGVTIERGCVLATGAVVIASTEPDGLYAGNPARLVRPLPT